MSEHAFLKHLREDHEQQKRLGKQLVEAKSPEERERLRKAFHEALYPHMIGEEASIFKWLKASNDQEIRNDALEGLQEHHVGKTVLRELMEIETEGDVFRAKAKVLDEMNRHHIEEEEDDIFQHLKNQCDEQQMSHLFEQYEDAEEGAKY